MVLKSGHHRWESLTPNIREHFPEDEESGKSEGENTDLGWRDSPKTTQ